MSAHRHQAPGPPSSPPAGHPAGRRPDASMSLLRDHVTHSLDPGYADAAARRAAGEPPGRVRPTPLLLAATLVLGLLLAVAADQARARTAAQGPLLAALVAEIRERTEANDRLESQVRSLRADLATARDDLLGDSARGQRTADLLEGLEASTGAGAVTGPGIVVTVEDAPRTGEEEAAEAADGDGRVRDRDLQRVVNGLWAAGAEAIAINGQRLTSLTAIRGADIAILVAYRPLSPPYAIEVVGNPEHLETRFADGPGGFYLSSVLRDVYGIRYDVARSDELRLPGASGVAVRAAEVPGPVAEEAS